jgi:hypothetical protein
MLVVLLFECDEKELNSKEDFDEQRQKEILNYPNRISPIVFV